ncbi:hypothetical protein AY600_10200 [Phormidium willei BDU 130791]|nr:hypothetical protein AY600_10200 [Phormidium willei BDU 130791]
MGELKVRRPAIAVLVSALAGAGLLGLAAGAAAADLPEVSAPDFARAEAVVESLEAMQAAIEEVKAQEGWRALRALDECATAQELIEEQVTATAYEAAGGEKLWRLCQQRYAGLQLH